MSDKQYRQTAKFGFAINNLGEPIIIGIVNAVEIEEEADDIFATMSTDKNVITYGFYYLKGEAVSWSTLVWCTKGDIQIKESSIPEELSKAIYDGIKQTKGIVKKEGYIAGCEDLIINVPANELAKVEEAHKAFISKLAAMKKSSGNLDLISFCERYVFKKHILVTGERGASKTYSIDKFTRDRGYKTFFIAGHEGLEGIDLLGYYTKDSKGNLVWLDGKLTEAFRASQHDKTVLFYDELLRTPSRELNLLVGSLTPSSVGTYRLATNRIIDIVDGVGKTEEIEVPMDNLWVVGTTNVGSKYNVDEIDHALSDRFRVYSKDVTTAEIDTVCSHWLSTRGFDQSLATKFVSLYTKLDELKTAGELESSINMRHLSEVIQYADNEKSFRSYLIDLLPNVCSTDMNGKLDKAEVEIITKCIKMIF